MITILSIFSFLQVLTSLFLLLANNPVHNILFLILLFSESIVTFFFGNFEFISLLFILFLIVITVVVNYKFTSVNKESLSFILGVSFFSLLLVAFQAKDLSFCEAGIDAAETVLPAVAPDLDSLSKNRTFLIGCAVVVGFTVGCIIWFYILPAAAPAAAVALAQAEVIPQNIPSLPVKEVVKEVAENVYNYNSDGFWNGVRWITTCKVAAVPSSPQSSQLGLARGSLPPMPSWLNHPKVATATSTGPDPFESMKACHWAIHPENPANLVKAGEALIKVVTETPGGVA